MYTLTFLGFSSPSMKLLVSFSVNEYDGDNNVGDGDGDSDGGGDDDDEMGGGVSWMVFMWEIGVGYEKIILVMLVWFNGDK